MRWIIALFCLAIAPICFAHSMMTAYLDLTESNDGTTAVGWRRPVFPGTALTIEPSYPSGVQIVATQPMRDEGTFTSENFVLRGAPRLWSDCVLGVKGNAPGGMEVLIRLQLANGVKHIAVLRNPDDTFVVPAQPGLWQAVSTYFALGLDHILNGFDHLMFVLGLLLLVSRRLTLVKTITAFTIAHTITLGIATLGYARAPLPPLNLAIALSIFLLAPEIVRKQRGQTSLAIERPWIVAFVFGLLHGFGFASGLTSLGLPREDIPFALLWFNIGVEAGQLGFVFIILMLVRSFASLSIRWPRWAQALPCYTVGSLGAFWSIERGAVFVKALL